MAAPSSTKWQTALADQQTGAWNRTLPMAHSMRKQIEHTY